MRSGAQNLKFLDDLAKVASGAVQSLGDIRGQVKSMVNAFLGEMDIVTREEFERVEALAQKARERQVELEKRLAALEKKLKTPAGKKKK
ncbi:MAG: accessory factor UbiK family protein [Alphaproteobacteria bacterium]|jgi:hypothetical protein|nr:accessory factor UbiK family protein [Alphaproteobacteria bacterium]